MIFEKIISNKREISLDGERRRLREREREREIICELNFSIGTPEEERRVRKKERVECEELDGRGSMLLWL